MNEIRLIDSGVELVVLLKNMDDEAVDISTATQVQFHFQKPDGSVLSVTGALKSDGTDGRVRYVTDSDDLDQVGIWKYQVYVTLPAGVLHSSQGKFRIKDIIKK